MIGMPYIAGGAALAIVLAGAGGYIKGRGDGRDVEAAKWQAAATKAAEDARKLAQERQEAVDRADAAAARSDALLDALRLKNAQTTKVYYETNPARNVACLDAGRVQHVAESDAAARKAAGAASASAK